VYISEIATVDWRGTFGTWTQLGIVCGILLSYVLGALMNWRWLAFAFTPFCLVMIVLMFFMPESPPWMLLKDNREGARKALVRLRGPTYLVDRELDFIYHEATRSAGGDASAKLGFGEFLKPLNLVPTLFAWLLMWNQQTSFINVVIFYSTQIFEAAGGAISSFASTVIMGVVQVLATVLASFLIDRAGRRILLIASSGLMLAALAALAAYFLNEDSAKASGLTMIPILAVCLFIAAFSIGYGPVPWLLVTEILPHRVRALVTSSSLVINWGLATIITFAFPPMVKALGTGTSFVIFTAVCALGFVTTILFTPETKRMTLPEIEPFWRRRCPCFFKGDPTTVSEGGTERVEGSGEVRRSGEAG
jgi:SP family facilitated glucose transporter-like MFS transporter 8